MSLSYLRAILFTAPLVALATAVMGTISLIASLFDSNGHTQHRVARMWSRMLLFIGGVRVRVTGGEKIDPKASYVIAANHLSFVDTPLVLAHIPLQFRFQAKAGLFKVPFIGYHLRRGGHIPIPRDDARAAVRAIQESGRIIREKNVSILIFPEGGRTEGELRPFKEGAALIAIVAGAPIVPVAIVGTRAVLPMGSIHVRPGAVELRIGDPIPTAQLTTKDRHKLNDQVRNRVAALTEDRVPA
jgi:1-acyl-sn-glycerol-3-phosphate acyltransferase